MNFWHIFQIKISHAIIAFLVIIGAAQYQPAPVVTPTPTSGQIGDNAASTGTPDIEIVPVTPKIFNHAKPKQNATTTPPESTPADAAATTTGEVASPAPTPVELPIYIINLATPTPMTEQPTSTPAPAAAAPAQAAPSYTLDLINPFPTKGMNRTFNASPTVKDDSNYVEIGLVVYDQNGNDLKDLTVTVNATDSTQNKTINGSGDVTPIYVNGEQKTVHYYAYHYEFRTAGQHTITFSLPTGETKSVTLTAN